MNILEKVTLGKHYFSTAILLRESLFLNSVLSSAEIWYGLTKDNIKELEDLDCSLLRKIFNAPVSVPREALFLELGIMNIGTIIKARRANYLHYLATQNQEDMLYGNTMFKGTGQLRLGWTLQILASLKI